MVYRGRILDTPINGERFIFYQTTEDPRGQLLAVELVVAPMSRSPAPTFTHGRRSPWRWWVGRCS
jgi:hypothetical protein